MAVSPSLKGHLKNGRYWLEGEGPTFGPRDGRGEVEAERIINISFAANIRIS